MLLSKQDVKQYECFKPELETNKSNQGYVYPVCGIGTVKDGTGISEKKEISSTLNNEKSQTDKYKTKIENAKNNFKGSKAEEYITSRGISIKTATVYWLGFSECESFGSEKAPALIIPINYDFYISRSLEQTKKQYSNSKNSNIQLFGAKKALKQKYTIINSNDEEKNKSYIKPIFVVEDAIDALSIIEVGGNAIAINSTSNVKILIDWLKTIHDNFFDKVAFILALNCDDSGSKATQKIIEYLKSSKFKYIDQSRRLYKEYKDANEALVNNKDIFSKLINTISSNAISLFDEKTDYILKNNMSKLFSEYLSEISNTRTPIKTGFENLDNILDGGLYPSLITIGAMSSLGKTTFCLQMADNIAQNGRNVLFFSLEMSKWLLVSKSISRLTFKENKNLAQTTMDLHYLAKAEYRSNDEIEVIAKAQNAYLNDIAPNMWIYDNNNIIPNLNNIEKEINSICNYCDKFGKERPVIFIDYIQILSPIDNKMNDKQAIDCNIQNLRRICQKLDIVIILISSLNRDSYNEPITMKAFKESGAIEYGSDLLIGLQYNGLDQYNDTKDRNSKIKKLLQENELKQQIGEYVNIDLKILKNRNGKRGSTTLQFCSKYNTFNSTLDTIKREDNNNDIIMSPSIDEFFECDIDVPFPDANPYSDKQ